MALIIGTALIIPATATIPTYGEVKGIALGDGSSQNVIPIENTHCEKFLAGTSYWKLFMEALGHTQELKDYEAKYGFIDTGDKKVSDIPGCHNIKFWQNGQLDNYCRIVIHDWGLEIKFFNLEYMKKKIAG